MFGYLRPCVPELKVSGLKDYRAVYCGLCGELGRSFGPFARLVLSYDFTFLGMLGISLSGEAPEYERRGCFCNPLKKIHCVSGEASRKTLGLCADIAAIALYHKLLDNIADSHPLWRLALPFVRPAFKRAAERQPKAAKAMEEAMRRQAQVEAANSGSVDEAAEPSAAAMAGIFPLLRGGEDRALERFGYLIGRYVYLCDAYDDMERDKKTGGFNPLLGKPPGYGKEALYMTAGEAGLAYNLLSPVSYKPVLDNIVFLGLKNTVDMIAENPGRARPGKLFMLGDV